MMFDMLFDGLRSTHHVGGCAHTHVAGLLLVRALIFLRKFPRFCAYRFVVAAAEVKSWWLILLFLDCKQRYHVWVAIS